MNKEQLISEMLCLPSTAIEYHIGQHLTTLFPDKALIETDYVNIEGYARAGLCTLTRQTFSYNQMNTYWVGPEPELMHWQHMGPQQHMHAIMGHIDMVDTSPGPEDAKQETVDSIKKAWLEVIWQDASLDILVLHIEGGGSGQMRSWIMADSEDVARGFFAAVSQWSNEIRSEVLVFDSGHWHKDEHLFQDIKGATFDNLILRGNLKQEIRDDLVQFFASRAIYEEHDIPWKRGILFVGPAGNGKTHAVKALINSLEQHCLYVKSFRSPHSHGADEIHIRQVFDRARRSAPCVLVLEDLDSLVTSQNRSFFLNELDGFAANIGIVTLATTNHPERLDPAILDRPSRFDRKYPFDLPAQAERLAYIALWNASLKPMLRLSDEGATKISELTAGFSFAYLKELFLSSKMRWIANPQQGAMEEVMAGQVSMLRDQMVSASTLTAEEPIDDQPQGSGPGMMARRIMFRGR